LTATSRSQRCGLLGRSIIVGLVVVLAGCGGDGDGADAAAQESFVADYERVTASFEGRTEEVRARGQAALGAGDEAVLDVYKALLAASDEAHEAYADIDPVADFRPAFQKLVEQRGEQREVLAAVVAAAEAGDDAELAVRLRELATVVVEVTNARRTLDRQLEQAGLAATET
jgi:septal ring factor EnvC (AmiA/AmiB activator)